MATATLNIEVELELTGDYVPYDGGYCEDIAINRLLITAYDGYDDSGRRKYRTIDVLASIDTSNPEVQKLLDALLEPLTAEAQEALCEAVGDDADVEWERGEEDNRTYSEED